MITNVRGRGQVEHRAFALSDMVRYGYGGLRSGGGGQIGESAVRGIPAIHRAARIRAEAIASLKLRCWRGEGPTREIVTDDWRARLFRDPPNEYQTRFGFWETVGESLAYRNNAFVWKNTDPLTGRVVELFALHPDQVKCEGAGAYKVTVRSGYVDPVGYGPAAYDVDAGTVLHVCGHGGGGTYEAPSPIDVFRDALAIPVARQRHEARMWRKGTSLQVAVIFPQNVNKDQADDWKDMWRSQYEGADGDTTAMIGGGADIKPIGMTARDASFAESAKLTVQDAARIMGVPAKLLEAETGDQATKLEDDLATWYHFGLGPELSRIESALLADSQLFGNARLIYPAFETEDVVRGDLQTEDDVAHQRIQDGRMLVDEWRAAKGLPPLPNGLGKVPQIVPVGGAPNPNLNGNPPEPVTNGAGND